MITIGHQTHEARIHQMGNDEEQFQAYTEMRDRLAKIICRAVNEAGAEAPNWFAFRRFADDWLTGSPLPLWKEYGDLRAEMASDQTPADRFPAVARRLEQIERLLAVPAAAQSQVAALFRDEILEDPPEGWVSPHSLVAWRKGEVSSVYLYREPLDDEDLPVWIGKSPDSPERRAQQIAERGSRKFGSALEELADTSDT